MIVNDLSQERRCSPSTAFSFSPYRVRSILTLNPGRLSSPGAVRDVLRTNLETAGDVRIGISGWRYKPWRGVFYPSSLCQPQELAYAAGIFNSIEINGTFYSLQRPDSFVRWAAETPNDFLFAVKGPRYITHMLRLKNVVVPLANFSASGLLRLGHKIGPILRQFPPSFAFDRKRLEAFAILPRSTRSASSLARRCDRSIVPKPSYTVSCDLPLRHAVEVRHPSFVAPEFIELLRAHRIALVCADTVAWTRLMDLTSDFIYCRLHGSQELYVSGYDDQVLDVWAARVAAWARGREPADAERAVSSDLAKKVSRDGFVYFDNDANVRAPFDAQGLHVRVNKLLSKECRPA